MGRKRTADDRRENSEGEACTYCVEGGTRGGNVDRGAVMSHGKEGSV